MLKRAAIALALLLCAAATASAGCDGIFAANQYCGVGTAPGFSAPLTLGGDCSLSNGSITCTKINGVAPGTMAFQNANAVAITGGTITGLPDPVNPTDAANKRYADAAAAGLVVHTAAKWATAGVVLPNSPTYNNGTGGVGATLTAGSNAAIAVDGGSPALNDRILVKDQASALQNGCYTVTTVGSGAAAWVLTRCTDFDQAATGEIATNAYFFVTAGTANTSSAWTLSTTGAITVGTTALAFSQFSASQSFTAGTGISIVGNVINQTLPGVAAATYGDSTHSAQVTFDSTGRATAAVSVPIAAAVQPATPASQFNASGSTTSTTGTISGASQTLTLASAIDFANGQGIKVNHGGSAFVGTQPSALSVTPTGVAGTTAYAYTVACVDAAGGVGQSIANSTTATGNATLSATNYNALAWSAGTGCAGYAVYGNKAGLLALIGLVNALAFNDTGVGSITAPDWLPAAPQTSASLPDWLVTSISSGGGTTTLTLAGSATTTVTGGSVLHDDTAALQAWINQCQSTLIPCYLNPGTYNTTTALSVTNSIQMFGAGRFASFLAPAVGVDGIDIVTANSIALHDFAVQYPVNALSAVSGISHSAPGGQESSYDQYYNLYVNQGFHGLTIDRAKLAVFSNLVLNGLGGSGVVLSNTTFADHGDNTIINSTFRGIAAQAVQYNSSGGLRFINNKINTAANGINLLLANGAFTSDLFVIGNSIEGITNASVLLHRAGATGSFSNVVVNSNELSGVIGVQIPTDAGGVWASSITLNGNVFIGANTASAAMYSIDSASGVSISGGSAISTNAATKKIALGSTATAVTIGTPIQGTGAGFSASTNAGSSVYASAGVFTTAPPGPVTVGASPFTYTAGSAPETLYFQQGATNTATVAKGAAAVANMLTANAIYPVELGPGDSIVITWTTTAPTYRKDIH